MDETSFVPEPYTLRAPSIDKECRPINKHIVKRWIRKGIDNPLINKVMVKRLIKCIIGLATIRRIDSNLLTRDIDQVHPRNKMLLTELGRQDSDHQLITSITTKGLLVEIQVWIDMDGDRANHR